MGSFARWRRRRGEAPSPTDREQALRAVDDLRHRQASLDRFRSRGAGNDINERISPGS